MNKSQSSVYARPDEIEWDTKNQTIKVSISDSPDFYPLDSESEQASILNDLLKVKDWNTASDFLEMYGPLERSLSLTAPSMVVEFETFMLAVETVQLGIALLKAIRNRPDDLYQYLFFYSNPSTFNGDCADIRRSRKRLKQTEGWQWRVFNSRLSLGDSAGNAYIPTFAPLRSAAHYFQHVQLVDRRFERMPWHRTAPGHLQASFDDAACDYKDPAYLIRSAALQVARLANESKEVYANVRPVETEGGITFESLSVVPDVWSAAILAFRAIVLQSSKFAYCPHPNCHEMYEVTKTNKKSCGRAACRKYVQRAEV